MDIVGNIVLGLIVIYCLVFAFVGLVDDLEKWRNGRR